MTLLPRNYDSHTTNPTDHPQQLQTLFNSARLFYIVVLLVGLRIRIRTLFSKKKWIKTLFYIQNCSRYKGEIKSVWLYDSGSESAKARLFIKKIIANAMASLLYLPMLLIVGAGLQRKSKLCMHRYVALVAASPILHLKIIGSLEV